MGKVASRRPLLLRIKWVRAAFAATVDSCLTCLLLLASAAHALDPNQRLTQYMHTSWRIHDGSAPAGMWSIAQTSDGFLWFSSPTGGMYRFDGVRFLRWHLAADDDSTRKIATILADPAGGLWAIGPRGVLHVKGRVVTSHNELDGLSPHSFMSVGSDGSLWITRSSSAASDAPLCQVTDRAVRCFGKSDGIPISPADALLPDRNGGFWIGGETALVHWHAGISEVYGIEALKSNVGDDGIVSLARGADGNLWVGIEAEGPGLGLSQFKEGAVKPFVTPTFDGSKVVVESMITDRNGNLWVGTLRNGLFRVHGNVVDHYGRTEGLSSDTVYKLFEDREGIVWAATPEGIDNFRDPRVTTFSTLEGLGPAASGVLAVKDGSIWVSNAGSLDHISKGIISSIRTGAGLPGHQVSRLLEDRAGNLWVGVDDGLYLFQKGHFRRLPEPNHQPLGMVVDMIEDTEGNIWAQCASKPPKLVRIRDFQVQEEFSRSQIPGGRLAPDPYGGIWLGTRDANLVLFRSGVVTKFPFNAKAYPYTNQMIVEPDGSVLAAFNDGLVGWRQGKVQRMTTENGLPCNPVLAFIQDNEKSWWLYTECGIVELADSELQRWWANPKVVVQTRLYDVLDGARPQPTFFNRAAVSSDGRVWFASSTVVQMVDPSKLSEKALPAETYIESVTVDRKEFAATDKLKLSPHPRDVQIDYTSPTFLIPQRVKFRYRLENYDGDWHDAGTRRQAFYTDLPPGKYTFRVVASNSDGVWNDSPARLDFSVTPAYYQTNWFRALCACLFLALLWAAYQWRVRQLHQQFEMTLEARVGERTRIARDLHDTLLQSFHGVLLRFQTALQLLPERPVEAKEKLGSAIEQAAEAITEGRDAVQGLRDSTTRTNDLALAISTLGEEIAADSTDQRPAFHVAVEGESRNLHPILRDEIYKIAAEALRNAFRHAQARQIEVEIRYDTEQFRLRVRDDGRGIDPAVLSRQGIEGHYGLPGMRERATIMGAKLTVWSEVDAGTEVEVRVPAGIAYATARKRSWLSQAFAAKAKG